MMNPAISTKTVGVEIDEFIVIAVNYFSYCLLIIISKDNPAYGA